MINYNDLKNGTVIELKPINQKAVIINNFGNNHSYLVRTDKNEILDIEIYEIAKIVG